MTFGEKIRELRTKRGWTQVQLGEKLNVSSHAISKWETDTNMPSAEGLKEVADLFKVTIDDLLNKSLDICGYEYIGDVSPLGLIPQHGDYGHSVYNANLRLGATLHRFVNRGDEEYSAIYVGNEEVFSCEREREDGMILCWNQSHIMEDEQ